MSSPNFQTSKIDILSMWSSWCEAKFLNQRWTAGTFSKCVQNAFSGVLAHLIMQNKNICHHCGSFALINRGARSMFCFQNITVQACWSVTTSRFLLCSFLPQPSKASESDLRKPGCVSELGFLAEHPRSPIHAPACAQGLLALLVIPATCRRKQQPNARSCLLPAQCFVPAVL